MTKPRMCSDGLYVDIVDHIDESDGVSRDIAPVVEPDKTLYWIAKIQSGSEVNFNNTYMVRVYYFVQVVERFQVVEGSLEELIRQSFPGRIGVMDMATDGVIVQMTGGMVMRIVRRETDYSTFEAGWIPFLVTASLRSGRIVTVVSGDRKLYSFKLRSLVPEPLFPGGAVTVPVGIGTPYGEVEKKKEKRIR